jgi:DNA-binding LacI/PurR family transcriptional regulator
MSDASSIPHVPIYQQLYDTYRQSIITQEWQPGTRINSITEIQQKHNVSRETAKIVLKKLAEEGLIIQKTGKGSFVADLGPRKLKWAVVVPFFSSFIENLLELIKVQAGNHNRNLEHYVDYNNPMEEIRLVGELINKRYEAVIVIPVSDETCTAAFYRNLTSGGTVVTLLNHTMAGSYFTYVIQSYDLGVKRAIKYLGSRTDKNLLFVKNRVWAETNMVQELMETTFRNFTDEQKTGRKALVSGHLGEIDRKYIEQNNIGGIFCCDDMDAVRIIGRLKSNSIRIPGDISLISYGNTELASFFTPGITSIDCHFEHMVEKTIEIIFSNLDGQDNRFSQYIIQPELVVRET